MDILSEPPFSLPSTFQAVDEAIDANADIAEAILEFGLPAFGVGLNDDAWKGQTTPNDVDKARSTIKQLYRDWSIEGKPERDACHNPILAALSEHLSEGDPPQRHRYRVLVPGAGLGRLVLDICARGYTVQGNEISYHQMLASNYILNATKNAGQHKLYPWALSFSNHLTRADQLRYVSIPDVNPADELDASSAALQSELHYSKRLSMTSGDFSVLYRQPEYRSHFHAVVTCFFIDTAPNVISYVETIKHCLKPGGVWINVGPLLWHFESSPTPAERDKQRKSEVEQHSHSSDARLHAHTDQRAHPKTTNEGIGEPGSFELSNDEVIALVQGFGFDMLQQSDALASATGYIQDLRSMLQNIYRPSFWVARKT